ncbi:MAG: thioredoxin family protein [Bacteroidia bacterium]|nr:thioredoxin family protein [Bacteroidia bacterium]NNF31259.1 DUF255 domain-containing protein [Flavobacteriaceae bacterium]MBT8275885.1 thioredoxin family protein [Bacteroidia bacterium]NNJ82944.1 DUF255 domain-containing protein [Flavobacteriaceae bacterium]NNK54546.1 DUF255 domain-containing protein [Flavobacteriaceae bacterium]
MKRIFIIVFAALISNFSIVAQDFLDPVSWEVTTQKESENRYNIILEATIDPGWHLYSQIQYGEEFEGPIPTEFSYNSSPESYTLVGGTQEPDVKPVLDPVFEIEVKSFDDKAVFIQPIEVVNPEGLKIVVEIYYSVCDDEKCLPPDVKSFEVDLASGKSELATAEITEFDLEQTAALTIPLKGDLGNTSGKKGYFTIFLLGFLGGILALLTPCVFPMIPLTVSFFTKGSRDRKKGLRDALLYGFFIFLIYVLLSLPFHLLDTVDEGLLNNISTNIYLNILFFIVFLVFAFSFFGYFEITLPSSWSTKMDEKATTIGGFVGIFFMALTLAIVSFSCTGPILGGLLGGSLSQDAGAMQLSFGMGGFGLALALPFALFALFPNWLNSLPSSGGWLNTVKVVLGFAELALAFKFLSNADLVMHWGVLKREVFMAIWILCSLGMALYLFGIIRFPHDGPKGRKLPKGNIIVGILAIVFTIYLIPGLTNTKYANLKLLSGLAPPMFYSLYDKGTSAPLGLTAYKDFYEGVEAAKKSGKPIMLDFTGWACVNCRKMEEHVWSVEEVFKVINEEFILISLYVDDRKPLEKEEQFNFLKPTGGTKPIKTIGDKWATFQTVNFKNNSQPHYALMDSDYKLLNLPIGYTPDESEYLAWLNSGLKEFNKNK